MDFRHQVDDHPLVFVAFMGMVHAMDRRSGQRVWDQPIGKRSPVVRLAVDAERVYALADNLICFEAMTGSVVWSVNGAEGGTLLVHGAQIFVGENGKIRCFSADDGKLLWKDEFKGFGMSDVAIAVPGKASQADRTG